MKPSPEQARIARRLGLNPDMPHTWPMNLINRLVGIEINKGPQELYLEVRRLLDNRD